VQAADEACNVIQTADPGFYRLQALAESEAGQDDEEDWPSSWVGNKGAFQGWTKTHLKKWLTVDLPPHLAQKAKELRNDDKEAKQAGNKAENKTRDDMPGASSTMTSDPPITSSNELGLAKTNDEAVEEGNTPQVIPSDKPLINIETSDKGAGAAPETNTGKIPNTETSSPRVQLSMGLALESPGGKSPDGSAQAGNQKDVRSLVDVSSPDTSTGNQPPRAPSPDRQSTSLTSLGLPTQGGISQLKEISTTGPQSPSMPIHSSTDNDSTSGFLDRNAERGSSTRSIHADKMPTPSRHSPAPSSVQGSFFMPKKVPEPPSLSTTSALVQADDTSSRYDGGFSSGPSFNKGRGLFASNLTNTVPRIENKAEETFLGDKTTNPILERPSSGQQLTSSGTLAANKELKDWGTRTPGDRIVAGHGIRLAGTLTTKTSAGPSEPGMTAGLGRFDSAAHQGGKGWNVIGELTRANLQRHEDFSQEGSAQGKEDANMIEEDPPVEWYEWYRKYHAEQKKGRKGDTEQQ